MKTLVLLFALLSASCAFAQNKDKKPKIDYWEILEKIKWKQIFENTLGTVEIIQHPQFSKKILALDGKKIYLEGYCLQTKDVAILTKDIFPDGELRRLPYFGNHYLPLIPILVYLELEEGVEIARNQLGTWEGTLEINTIVPHNFIYTLKNVQFIPKPIKT